MLINSLDFSKGSLMRITHMTLEFRFITGVYTVFAETYAGFRVGITFMRGEHDRLCLFKTEQKHSRLP